MPSLRGWNSNARRPYALADRLLGNPKIFQSQRLVDKKPPEKSFAKPIQPSRPSHKSSNPHPQQIHAKATAQIAERSQDKSFKKKFEKITKKLAFRFNLLYSSLFWRGEMLKI